VTVCQVCKIAQINVPFESGLANHYRASHRSISQTAHLSEPSAPCALSNDRWGGGLPHWIVRVPEEI